jgi:hypothetical protein
MLAAVFGAADAVFQPAYASIIPDILPGGMLLDGNALNASSRLFALQMAGPALGGLAIALVGPVGAFWLDAGSFATSVCSLVAIRGRQLIPLSGHSIISDIGDGIRTARSIRWLWTSLFVGAMVNLFVLGPLVVVLPLMVRTQLGVGPGGFGLVTAAFGLGGAGAAVLVSQLPRLPRRASTMYVGWGTSGLAIAMIGLFPRLGLIAVFTGVAGFALAVGNLLWTTMVQMGVSSTMLGKVASLDWLVAGSAIPISIAASGPVASSIGFSPTFVLGGLVTTLAVALTVAAVPEALEAGIS